VKKMSMRMGIKYTYFLVEMEIG